MDPRGAVDVLDLRHRDAQLGGLLVLPGAHRDLPDLDGVPPVGVQHRRLEAAPSGRRGGTYVRPCERRRRPAGRRAPHRRPAESRRGAHRRVWWPSRAGGTARGPAWWGRLGRPRPYRRHGWILWSRGRSRAGWEAATSGRPACCCRPGDRLTAHGRAVAARAQSAGSLQNCRAGSQRPNARQRLCALVRGRVTPSPSGSRRPGSTHSCR